MPELPEVETTKTSLDPLIGKKVCAVTVYQPRLREMIADLSVIIGKTLSGVDRRAKYLLLSFDGVDDRLVIHLGMSGSLQQYPNIDKRKHDHAIIDFGDVKLHYHDPRRFGMIIWETDAQKYFKNLSVEPLSTAFNGKFLYDCCQKSTKPIKSLIMNQQVVVGVGNIYATESLFLAKISPKRASNTLSLDDCKRLVKHIKQILKKAIEQGGSTLKDFTVGAGKTGYFTQTLYAYGQAGKPCTICHLPLETTKIDGRASVFCISCQN